MIDTIRPIDTFSYELMIKTLDYTEYLLILPVENMSNTGKKRDWGVKMPVLSRFFTCVNQPAKFHVSDLFRLNNVSLHAIVRAGDEVRPWRKRHLLDGHQGLLNEYP